MSICKNYDDIDDTNNNNYHLLNSHVLSTVIGTLYNNKKDHYKVTTTY